MPVTSYARAQRAGVALAPMLLIASMSLAQEAPQAFVNARIIPMAGPVIERGVLVVQDAKILAVGSASSVQVPGGAKRHDLDGKTIMPGLVDTHSHIGGGSGGDRSAPIQPDVRILDALDVRNTGIRRARAGGITTVNVMPGSGHLLSGQTLYVKLRRGSTIDDLLIRDQEGHVAGGLKMANGTNSIDDPPFPGTRAKSAALARKAFVEAIDYREKLKRAGDDPEKRPARDLGLETLLEVLDGRRVVHFHTHRHDDILTVIRLSEEFGFKPVLQHVSEGWKVADEIAKAGLACSVIVLDSPGGKIEAKDVSLTTGAVLDKAGVLVGFHTDDYITDSRLFLRSAALAVRAGMARERALAALTTAGAQMLGLEQRIGSLEAGKDADFIVLSGDPLSVYTHVEQTWIEGEKVFDRSNAEDRLYAVGGYGASRDGDVHVELEEEAR
jgi:imidazolonepropionase-like amidohydrolase